MARPSSGDDAICHVLPVLWMTSRLQITVNGQEQATRKKRTFKVTNPRAQNQSGAESTIALFCQLRHCNDVLPLWLCAVVESSIAFHKTKLRRLYIYTVSQKTPTFYFLITLSKITSTPDSYMDEHTFTLLYKSMVRPHVEFANSVWCPYK